MVRRENAVSWELMSPDTRIATAHHEAGHAVIAFRLQGIVEEVVLCGDNEPKNRATVSGLSNLSLQAKFQIAVAGPMAELKYRAMKEWGCEVSFSLTNVEGLVRVAYQPDSLEQVSQEVYFNVAAGEVRILRPRDGDIFADFDDLCESGLSRRIDEEHFKEKLCETMKLLDLRENWRCVELVAQELLRRGILSGVRFREILKQTE